MEAGFAGSSKGAATKTDHTIKKTIKIIVIKSTIAPGTTARIKKECTQILDICFSPEFLTEANSFEDFKNLIENCLSDSEIFGFDSDSITEAILGCSREV